MKSKNELSRVIMDMRVKQGVTEELKAIDQMNWLDLMNNIKAQAGKIIYVQSLYNKNLLLNIFNVIKIFDKIKILDTTKNI